MYNYLHLSASAVNMAAHTHTHTQRMRHLNTKSTQINLLMNIVITEAMADTVCYRAVIA